MVRWLSAVMDHDFVLFLHHGSRSWKKSRSRVGRGEVGGKEFVLTFRVQGGDGHRESLAFPAMGWVAAARECAVVVCYLTRVVA